VVLVVIQEKLAAACSSTAMRLSTKVLKPVAQSIETLVDFEPNEVEKMKQRRQQRVLEEPNFAGHVDNVAMDEELSTTLQHEVEELHDDDPLDEPHPEHDEMLPGDEEIPNDEAGMLAILPPPTYSSHEELYD
jgi:hypothetical protein